MNVRDIGKSIREKRIEKGWCQEELAERAELSTGYIGMIERGRRVPTLETFIAIANALQVSADELLSDVMDYGYEIKMSEYTKRIEKISPEKREPIYLLLDILLRTVK